MGTALIRSGLERLAAIDVEQVFVLGDPAWYRRFGFAGEKRIDPPYPLPAEWQGAWQSIRLKTAEPPRPGKLVVPRPWRRPALWRP